MWHNTEHNLALELLMSHSSIDDQWELQEIELSITRKIKRHKIYDSE